MYALFYIEVKVDVVVELQSITFSKAITDFIHTYLISLMFINILKLIQLILILLDK